MKWHRGDQDSSTGLFFSHKRWDGKLIFLTAEGLEVRKRQEEQNRKNRVARDPAKECRRQAEWRALNHEARTAYDKTYHAANKAARVAKAKRWAKANPAKARESVRKASLRRYHSCPMYRLLIQSRGRLGRAFKAAGFSKDTRTIELLGCSLAELKVHIEAQFVPGMSWEKRAAWHIDHKRPLASATTPEELRSLCHYKNLQPLWAQDNIRKGAKVLT